MLRQTKWRDVLEPSSLSVTRAAQELRARPADAGADEDEGEAVDEDRSWWRTTTPAPTPAFLRSYKWATRHPSWSSVPTNTLAMHGKREAGNAQNEN